MIDVEAAGTNAQSRRIRLAAYVMVVVVTFGLFFAINYQVAWPSRGGWPRSDEYHERRRSAGFEILERAMGRSVTVDEELKVYLGWSQNVWIVMRRNSAGGGEVGMMEMPIIGEGQAISRRFNVSPGEFEQFLSRFDNVALGYRVFEGGLVFDGREISFERRQGKSLVNYSGNASFVPKDAEMATVVDQFVLAHGGYAFLDVKRWQ